MRKIAKALLATLAMPALVGCGAAEKPVEPAAEPEPAAEEGNVNAEAEALLEKYNQELAELEKKANLAYWKAANSGKKEDFEAYAEADLALEKLHSDPDRFSRIEKLRGAEGLDPLVERSLETAYLAFKGNQLPDDLLEKMVNKSAAIEEKFNTFRAELDGEKKSNNDLLKMLAECDGSERRLEIWKALKQVGAEVGPMIVELAGLRNEAARQLGYDDFWQMRIDLQEHDPEQLMAIFAELEEMTDGPFSEMKAELDAELAERFGIEPEEMMPWHYDNPFFQAAPPSAAVDLDEFYEDRKKEDIVDISKTFYADIGLPIEDILARSDLYEREGKHQHAFCISIDRAGDVRTLLNIQPDAKWMDTILHEEGHAVYDLHIDRDLPYNLREMAHIFTTEAVAMLFGALAKNPTWMVGYAGADEERVAEVEEAIYEQRRREQLIFARWTMVMLHFEKAMYENPERDLGALWWDNVERFQMLERPPDRDAPDWAAKPHFTIAPVYYHNYQLGELFAAQLRDKLVELAGHEGPTRTLSFNGRKEFGEFFKERVFSPGRSVPWPEFVEQCTGRPLTAEFFAREVK